MIHQFQLPLLRGILLTVSVSISVFIFASMSAASVAAQDAPPAAPSDSGAEAASESPTKPADVAPAQAAGEPAADASDAADEQPVVSIHPGIVCVQPLGKTVIPESESDEKHSVSMRFDSGPLVEVSSKGATITGLPTGRKHRITLYAAGEFVQSFNITLSKYAKPLVKLGKKPDFDTWVLRRMATTNCGQPLLADRLAEMLVKAPGTAPGASGGHAKTK